jgi:hypothetical protein
MMRRFLGILGLTTLLGVVVFVWGINDFLAITSPVDGNILVVEGWIWHSTAMREAAEEFKHGHYTRLVIVGSPVDRHDPRAQQESSAELAAQRLRELGVSNEHMIILPVPDVKLHHTHSSAVTVRNWLITSHTEIRGVNIFTLGTHARKSLVLFSRALGPDIKVGVIAGTEDTYDTKRWWLSPRGIYVVARKAIGYLYALVWPFQMETSTGEQRTHA